MGFDLKVFFEVLERMLKDGTWEELEEFVKEQREYAKQCNQL